MCDIHVSNICEKALRKLSILKYIGKNHYIMGILIFITLSFNSTLTIVL